MFLTVRYIFILYINIYSQVEDLTLIWMYVFQLLNTIKKNGKQHGQVLI